METKTIINLRNVCGELRSRIDEFQEYYKKGEQKTDTYAYGRDSEYSIDSIVRTVQNILTDVSFLTNNHDIFVKDSTYTERTTLFNSLSRLSNFLRIRSVANIVSTIEDLKLKLRIYHPNVDKERFVEFETEIGNVRQLSNSLENDIESLKTKFEIAGKKYDQIADNQEKYNEIIKDLDSRRKDLVQKTSDLNGEYANLTNTAKEVKEQLKSQTEQIKEFEYQLDEWGKSYKDNKEEADKLITDARRALNYATAKGISDAFNVQRDEAMKSRNVAWWIGGAIFFVLTTLFIGLWIVCGWWLPERNEENSSQLIFSLIGRLSMVTLTISGAVFCTKQYIKQKNIIEDYAYKTTIAKSIAVFSEELREKSPEKYAEYISIILKEIYQDPLRERSNRNDAISISGNDIMEKILSIVQGQIDRNV